MPKHIFVVSENPRVTPPQFSIIEAHLATKNDLHRSFGLNQSVCTLCYTFEYNPLNLPRIPSEIYFVRI